MPKPPNRHRPLAEPLLAQPGVSLRKMFGAEAIYAEGVLLLVLADGEAPWNGLLYPAERPQHPAILAQFPFLTPHAVLPKWLFLCEEDDRFEARAESLMACLLVRDERFGVLPKPRPRKGAAKENSLPRSPESKTTERRPPHLR